MNILLYHCSFHNQGDVLMLISAKKILQQLYPNSHFSVLSYNMPDMKVLKENNIDLINLNINYLIKNKTLPHRFISKTYKIINKKELHKLRKINVVIDVNGYFIGDKWGVQLDQY